MTLTADDLNRTLADERHLGWGYQCCLDIESATTRARLERAVVAVANEQQLDYERLFRWSNSKWGRWLYDGVRGCGEPPTRATVRRYLNERSVAEACDVMNDSDGTATLIVYEGSPS